MNRDEFWAIVESVGWGTIDTDYKRGKQVLLKALPTLEECDAFGQHRLDVESALSDAIDYWCALRDTSLGLGDDSFDDLCAHIVGLGREEYERNLANPSLAQKRAESHAFEESFAYCEPHDTDYEPLEIQLAREVSGLLCWQENLENGLMTSCAQSEVERRGAACDALRERLLNQGGTEWTQKQYEAHIRAQHAASRAQQRALRDFDDETSKLVEEAVAAATAKVHAERRSLRETLRDSFGVSEF